MTQGPSRPAPDSLDAGNFPNLFDQEMDALGKEVAERRSLCGLALSGGGIRSATFNLGVLQGLQKAGLLGSLDYISTVSGGGYIAGFWAASRKAEERRRKEEEEEEARRKEPAGSAATDTRAETQDIAHTASHAAADSAVGAPATSENRVEPEAAAPFFPEPDSFHIQHLRRFSNFLRPRLPLFSSETGRMAAAMVAAIVPSVAATVGVLSTVLLFWAGVTFLIMDLAHGWAVGIFGTLLALGFLGIGALWHSRLSTEARVPGERLCLVFWGFIATAISTIVWWIAWWIQPLPFALRVLPAHGDSLAQGHLLAALLPSGTLLAGTFVLITLRTLTSRWCDDVCSRRRWHGTLDSTLAASLYMALGGAALGLLWVGGQWLAADGPGGVVATLSASGAGATAFALLRRFLGRQPNKPEGRKVRSLAAAWLLQILAYLTIAAALLTVAALLSRWVEGQGLVGLGIAAGVSLALCLDPFFFDPEEVGFHSFYRARLARAFLGAAQDGGTHATQETPTDDLRLSDLAPGKPLHLFCCAANDLAGDPLHTYHRGAESAVLSRLGIQVGEYWGNWKGEVKDEPGAHGEPRRDQQEDGFQRAPTLSAAMTASGAAFNSHMGAMSMRFGQGVTFLLTALNLRLGLWVDNPMPEATRGERPGAPTPDWMPAFYRELFVASSLKAPRIHLSDGGHFENLGLYELIRRKCRFLVVCDCGADPDYAFDDLGNAIRRVRADFGVEIEIDPAPLRPGKEGRAAQAAVVGTISYPQEEPGLLLLIKPTLLGNEPTDVTQYATRSSDFPQQNTVDQFYDEAQWEAYRRLGQHIVESLFQRLKRSLDGSRRPEDRWRWSLVQALFELVPREDVTPELHLRLEKEWHGLEADLAAAQNTNPLARQVLSLGTGMAEPSEPTLDPLPTLRRALHIMEGVCDAYGLHRDAEVAGSICWVNRIGHWASAPLFRAWWPLLEPLYSRDLTEFLQNTYQLPSWRDGGKDGDSFRAHIEPLAGCTGYARAQWKARYGKEPEGKQGLGYFVSVAGAEVLLALVWIRWEKAGERWIATWNMDDFFIPPGLWGVGIADRFRAKLVEKLKEDPLEAIRVTYRQDQAPPPALVALCAAEPLMTLEPHDS